MDFRWKSTTTISRYKHFKSISNNHSEHYDNHHKTSPSLLLSNNHNHRPSTPLWRRSPSWTTTGETSNTTAAALSRTQPQTPPLLSKTYTNNPLTTPPTIIRRNAATIHTDHHQQPDVLNSRTVMNGSSNSSSNNNNNHHQHHHSNNLSSILSSRPTSKQFIISDSKIEHEPNGNCTRLEAAMADLRNHHNEHSLNGDQTSANGAMQTKLLYLNNHLNTTYTNTNNDVNLFNSNTILSSSSSSSGENMAIVNDLSNVSVHQMQHDNSEPSANLSVHPPQQQDNLQWLFMNHHHQQQQNQVFTSSSLSSLEPNFSFTNVSSSFSNSSSLALDRASSLFKNIESPSSWFSSTSTAATINSNNGAASNRAKYCPPAYDGVSCWRLTRAGQQAIIPCFSHLNGVPYDTSQNATRMCLANGTWSEWADYENCRPSLNITVEEVPMENQYLQYTTNIYYFGYGLSLVALSIALFIFLYFKELRCVRNTIHKNLMFTYLLIAICWITTDRLHSNPSQTSQKASCITIILLTYLMGTNFSWMFVEGLYLYILVVKTFSIEFVKITNYVLIGWVSPALVIICWSFIKYYYSNIAETVGHMDELNKPTPLLDTNHYNANQSTMRTTTTIGTNRNHHNGNDRPRTMNHEHVTINSDDNHNMTNHNVDVIVDYNQYIIEQQSSLTDEFCSTLSYMQSTQLPPIRCPYQVQDEYDYIYKVPILLVLIINIFFLGKIMWMLITKLRASNSIESKQYRKAAKALLVLIPLLGVGYMLVLVTPTHPTARIIFQYLQAILVSTQGFTVAVLYCFCNGEVRNSLRNHFQRFRLRQTLRYGGEYPSQHSITYYRTTAFNSSYYISCQQKQKQQQQQQAYHNNRESHHHPPPTPPPPPPPPPPPSSDYDHNQTINHNQSIDQRVDLHSNNNIHNSNTFKLASFIQQHQQQQPQQQQHLQQPQPYSSQGSSRYGGRGSSTTNFSNCGNKTSQNGIKTIGPFLKSASAVADSSVQPIETTTPLRNVRSRDSCISYTTTTTSLVQIPSMQPAAFQSSSSFSSLNGNHNIQAQDQDQDKSKTNMALKHLFQRPLTPSTSEKVTIIPPKNNNGYHTIPNDDYDDDQEDQDQIHIELRPL